MPRITDKSQLGLRMMYHSICADRSLRHNPKSELEGS